MDQKSNTVSHGKSLPRTTPENVGLSSSRVCEFLLRCFERGMRGFMLYRKGYVFAEAHPFPFEAEDKKQVYSVSKSWTATAVGLAVNEGLLQLDDCVVSFFPNEIPDEPSPFLLEMTVRNLLTMTSGHAEDSLDVLASNVDNPERAFLAIPIKYKPGSRFVYDNGATYMLSSILASVTGESLLDYLRPRLLEPLGISGISWVRSPLGVCGGGWGLYVSTEDMLRFGILYLNQGVFGGKRILSDRWIDEACVYQIDNREENGDHDNDWESGYGYQFWISRFGREHKAYRADGAFKQFIVIVPECQLVFAYTGYNNAGQPVLDMLWRLCGEISEEPLPENKTESRRLKKTAEALAYPTEKNTSTCRGF